MQPVRILLALALLFAVAGFAHAGAKKQSAVNVRFYPEGGAEGGEFSQKVELLNPKRTTYMAEIPLISERDVTAYLPFDAQDGSGTYGAYLKLDDHGTNLLAQHTMSRRGSYLLVFFNGRHVIDLYTDKAVTDGIASIPSGLTQNDIALLDMTFPVIGHENVKPSSKKKSAPPVVKQKPSPAPKPADMPRMAPAMVRQPDGTLAPAQVLPQPAASETLPPVNAVGQ